MAIKIRKKVEAEVHKPVTVNGEQEVEAQEAEVLDAGGVGVSPDFNVQTPDEAGGSRFMRTSGSFFKWLEQHARQVILVCALVLVAFGIGYALHRSSVLSEEKDSSVLMDVLYAYDAPTKAYADDFAEAQRQEIKTRGIASDTQSILQYTNVAPNENIRHRAILDALTEKRTEIAASPIVNMVDLMIAGSESKLGRITEAEANYAKLVNGGTGEVKANEDVRMFALMGLAETQVQQNKLDEAISSFSELRSLNEMQYGAFSTLRIAQIYEQRNETDKAVDAYALIVSKYSSDIQAQTTAIRRLKLLTPDWEAKLAAPTPEVVQPAAL